MMSTATIETETKNLSEDYKIQILKSIIEYFPKTFEQICQEITTKYGDLENDSDEILAKIISDDSFLDQRYIHLTNAYNYYLKFDFHQIIEPFTTLSKEIENYDFFKEANKTKKYFHPEILEEIYEKINNSNDLFENLYSELTHNIKDHVNFIRGLRTLLKSSEINNFKKEFEKKTELLIEARERICKIYENNLAKLKIIEDKIMKLNENAFSSHIDYTIDNYITGLEIELRKLEAVIAKSKNFQFLPLSQIVNYYSLISEASITFNTFNRTLLLKNIAEINNTESRDTLKELQNDFILKYKEFMDVSRQNFNRYLMNIADKKAEIRSRFLEPNKSKFTSKDYWLFNFFIEQLY